MSSNKEDVEKQDSYELKTVTVHNPSYVVTKVLTQPSLHKAKKGLAGRTTDKNWEEKKPKDYHTSNSITREIRSKVSRGNICNKEYCKYIPVASAVVVLFANAVFLLAAIIVFSQQDSSQLNLNEMLSVRFQEFYNNITSLLHQ